MWDRTRYQNYCVQTYQRAVQNSQHQMAVRTDIHQIAERELDRDWTLRSYIDSRTRYASMASTRLAEDIHMYGEMSRLMEIL